jgi:hypothetical protein
LFGKFYALALLKEGSPRNFRAPAVLESSMKSVRTPLGKLLSLDATNSGSRSQSSSVDRLMIWQPEMLSKSYVPQFSTLLGFATELENLTGEIHGDSVVHISHCFGH